MIQEFLEFFDKAAGLPLAVVVSLVFIGLVIYVVLIAFPKWYGGYHKVIENNTLTTAQHNDIVKSMTQATQASADATLAVSKSVDLLRDFLQEQATKEAMHHQETKELRGDVVKIQDEVQDIHLEVIKLGTQVNNIRG